MALNYSTFKTQIATLAVVPEDDENFEIVLPQAIEYAQLRLQRELDFLQNSAAVTSGLSTSNRTLLLSAGLIVVSEQINLLLPAGSTNPETSERHALTATTKEFCDAVYGSASQKGLPLYYAPFNDNEFIVAPYPDANYIAEVVGTVRFPLLSVAQPTNFLSLYLPDLFIAAAMIFISGFQRNFGAQSDDARMALSWSQQYQELLQGAMTEEARKKYQAAAWSSESSSQFATSSR